MHDDPEYLSVDTSAQILDVDRETVIRWIRAGRLHAYRLPGGRLYRIRRSDLEAALRPVIELPTRGP